MPHIVIKMYPGRSKETKKALADSIKEDVCRIAKCSPKSVSLDIVEIPEEQWTEKVYQPEIQTRMDQLAIKPGYSPLE